MRAVVMLWLLAGTLTASAAQAGDLYKCSDKSGQVSIQSEPCAKDATQVWKRDAAPELPPTSAQQQALQERRAREASEARQLSRMAGTAPVIAEPEARPKKPAAAKKPTEPELPQHDCRKAHQFAEAVREKTFLELSNHQLSALSSWVAEQCREPE